MLIAAGMTKTSDSCVNNHEIIITCEDVVTEYYQVANSNESYLRQWMLGNEIKMLT